MTTQAEVVTAFANFEDEPRRASNLAIRTPRNDSRAFLVGGGNAVYAKREPINRIVQYPDWRRGAYSYSRETNLTSRGLQRQARKVLRILPSDTALEQREDIDEDRVQPLADNIDCL